MSQFHEDHQANRGEYRFTNPVCPAALTVAGDVCIWPDCDCESACAPTPPWNEQPEQKRKEKPRYRIYYPFAANNRFDQDGNFDPQWVYVTVFEKGMVVNGKMFWQDSPRLTLERG